MAITAAALMLASQAGSVAGTGDRNDQDQFGLHWHGPLDSADASPQSSALDGLNAAARLTRPAWGQ